MRFFVIDRCEVPRGLGPNTVMTGAPPNVSRLHLEIDGWMGDALIESSPVYLVTETLAEALARASLTGFAIDVAEVTTSEQLRHVRPGLVLPIFHWLKVRGRVDHDDLALDDRGRLVVSELALHVLGPASPTWLQAIERA